MKITAKPKRVAAPPRDVVTYLERLVAAPVEELVPIFREVDVWRWPRGDLHPWIPILDKVDEALEGIINSYELTKPQMNPFTPKDRELVLESLRFVRILLENNTSRKLYASFDRCYDLLCTSDMEVLLATLYILLRPGQTYTHQPSVEAGLLKKLLDRLLAFVHTENLKEYATGAPVDPKVTVTYYKTSSSSVDLSHITPDETDQLFNMDLPVDDHLSALMSIRRKYFDDRELLTHIHLVALATYVFYSASASLEHALFLYEPELVPKTAELLSLSDPICAAALLCLDALIRHKNKLAEVISAIGINLNHGPLFTILRAVAKEERSYDVLDATMGIIGYLLDHTAHTNTLTGAGILPILLDMTAVPDARIVPRACGVIDNLVVGQLHGMQMFSNADGVNIIVNRIKEQVETAQVVEYPLLSDEHARLYSMQPLQKLLRTVQSLMKASGASEGMRNLVDGELPKSIKRIFENDKYYGTRAFALAISVMTTFINNEPTSLSILQEMGLPQTLYQQLEKGVPATTESTIGNAISAICLNSAGLDLTKQHPAIIRNLIRTSIEEPDKPLEPDAGGVGMSMEELARHQQALRPIIENATLEQVKSVIEKAARFEPAEDQLSDYHLDKIRRDGTVTSVTSNPDLVRIARTFRFLEGVTRDSTFCVNLIEQGLLPMLLSVLEMPCIPLRFGTTEAATVFSNLVRSIGKHDHIKLAEAFIEAIDKQSISLDADKWAAFHKEDVMDPDFRKLRTVAALLTYFAEFAAGLTAYTHHRMMTSLLKVIKPEFLHRLGEYAHMTLAQHAGLKTPPPAEAEVSFDTETHDNGKETGAKFLATRTYSMTTRFLRSVLRMTFVKRVPEVTKSEEAKAVIGAISQIMTSAFSTPSLPGKEAETLVQAVCFNATLLFEDSRNSVLQLVLAPTYDFEPLLRAADDLIEHHDVKVLALLLQSLVNHHAIFSSPQMGLLPDPAKFLVKLRHTLFPTVERMWNAEWLTDAPIDTIKLVVKTFLQVMVPDKEEASEPPATTAPTLIGPTGVQRIPVPRPRAPVTANPAAVDQLVDMGFSRGGAELALIRAHNNIAAATELILGQPHLYADVPDPEPAPAEAAPDAADAAAPADGNPAPANAAETDNAAAAEAAADAEAPAEDEAGDIEMAIAVPGNAAGGVDQQIMEGLQQILGAGLGAGFINLAPAAALEVEDPLKDDKVDHRSELVKLREAASAGVPKRALTLIDHSEDLVFVCGPAFPKGKEGYEYVVEQLKQLLPYDGTKESAVSARLRMSVVLAREKDVIIDSPPIEILCALPFEPTAKWNSAYLLLGEIAMAAATKVTETKIGDEPTLVVEQIDLGDLPRRLKQLSLHVMSDASVERTPLLTALRMLAILSRSTSDLPYADILAAFRKPGPRLAGCQPLLALILRHAFEDAATLKAIMRREMQSWSAAGKVSDINHFVKQLKQAAFRSPTAFVEAANAECALVDPTPSTAVFHIRRKDIKDVEESDPFTEAPSNSAGRTIIDLLLAEFSAAASAVRENKDDKDNHAYAGLIMSLLTELVGSYIPAKTTLLAALRQQKGKGIASLITEMDQRLTDPADSPVRSISKWQSAFLVGLCADIGITSDIKHVAEDLITVRRAVLDAITKAFKDVNTDLDQRYGRLAVLGDLVHKLLTNRSHGIGRQDESATHMAKVMIEKNLVGTLTAATSEIDLNFPQVGKVLTSLLKALELLSKISTKWGKAEKDKERQVEEDEGSESSDSDDGMSIDDDEDEAQDLYRNSALGMLNNEMDEDSEEEDDEEEDEMMQYEEEAMEDMLDEEDGMTEPSDEEGSDIDMDDEDMENEWTDEEDGGEMEMDVDDGGEDDGMIEREAILAPPGDDDEEDVEQWDDEDMGGTDEEEDYGEEYDDYMMDEYDEYDDPEVDFYDDGLEAVYGPPADTTGPWGWAQQGPRLSFIGDGGESVRAESAAHPLIAPPVVRPRAQPRDYTSRAGVNDLLRDIQQMRTPESMAALDALMTSHRANGQVPVQIDMHADADHIGIRIDGRTFNLTRPAANAPPPDITSEFLPRQTMSRWLEEWNVIPGCDLPEQSARLVMHIVNRLMPEAKKAAEQAEEEAAKKAAEDEKKAEEERKEREEQERKEEAEAEQKKAEEERLRAEAEAEAARVAAEATRQAAAVPLPESRSSDTPQPPAEDVEMAETSEAGPSNAAPEPAEPAQVATRTVIQIHGRDVDITDTGIDLDFLEALPDDLRADVVDQHMRERDRVRRPAATGADPESELSEDFLNALPPEIQAELLMQEAMEGARRQAAQAPAVAAPAASTGAAPRVRPAQAPMPMPRAFLEQARQRLEQIGERAGLEIPGGGRLREIMEGLDEIMAGGPGAPRAAGRRPAHNASRPHREALQLLDKHGIASLVRLLFFPGGPSEESLFNILIHLCENTTTRSDLLNLLISVVQDGSGDLLAVDRSFQQMSIKAMATPKATPKVRIPDTPGASGSNTSVPIFSHLSPEHVPAFIAQRCFDALLRIVQSNTLAINFFLTEHEQPVGLKKVVGKKGKGKEKMLPQTRFPIVILLGLLDRPVLLKTSAMMEAFTGLLAVITRPLATLKETQDAEAAKSKEGESVAATDAAPAVEASSATPARPSAVTPGAAVATPAVTAATSAPPTESAAAKPPSLTKPPTIPAPVLRLVVNCLTGECSSQTFSNALRVMRNLSSSAEAKEVILSELRAQCTALGKVLQTELDELAPALDSADAEAAMAKFTPASSSQAQLLRLLKTIDYLQTNKDEQQSDKAEEVKEDIFAAFDFGSMWKQLSKCLSIVENKGSTDQIAIALLPLVEALMVVCKYHSETGELFTSFTTAHRKVLNAIVRNKPTLLSGSFSLLVRNPRVLEFDNKRNWFFQQLKKKKDQVHVGSMHLNVRRQYVFEDSFHAIQRKSGEEFKYAKLNVKFTNEDGIDATGLTREWYSVLAKQIFDPNFALFEPCAADQQTYQPNKASGINGINPDHLSHFKFVGRVIGKSIYDGRLLDAYFNRAFYKQILGREVDMRDLESIDPEYHKSLQWMLDNDITGVIDQEFTIEDDQFGEKKVVELKEDGAKIPVTEENKQEYVRLVVSYRLDNSIKQQIKAFLDGFYDIIPQKLVQIFEPDQLELLISGITKIDVDELKNSTQMAGYKSTDPEINWFWRALRSFSQEERSRFLMFVTSSSRVPLGGFTMLQGASGTQPMQIQKLYSKDGGLPQASTCFNLLLLPKYESYEHLREKLVFAMTETSGFGKA